MQRLHPPSGRVGNERRRVSGEGGGNTEGAAIRPPRRLVPRLRPSHGEGEVCIAQIRFEGATEASHQTTVSVPYNPITAERFPAFHG